MNITTDWVTIAAAGTWSAPVHMPKGIFEVSNYGTYVGSIRLQKHILDGPLSALTEEGWQTVDVFTAPAMGLPCEEALDAGGWWRIGAATGEWTSGAGYARLKK